MTNYVALLRGINVGGNKTIPMARLKSLFETLGLAPAKTHRAVIDKLNAETVAALSSPELRKAFEERDILPSGNSPEEFGRFIQSELNKWRDLAAKVGIAPE